MVQTKGGQMIHSALVQVPLVDSCFSQWISVNTKTSKLWKADLIRLAGSTIYGIAFGGQKADLNDVYQAGPIYRYARQ